MFVNIRCTMYSIYNHQILVYASCPEADWWQLSVFLRSFVKCVVTVQTASDVKESIRSVNGHGK